MGKHDWIRGKVISACSECGLVLTRKTCAMPCPPWDLTQDRSKDKLVVYNTTDSPIMIVRSWTPDKLGGPGIREENIMISPGQGIDLHCIGLKEKTLIKD